MTEKSAWKKALREPNAIGWIAFLLLVVAIGVGTVIFGNPPVSVKNQAVHVANPSGLK